MKKYIIILSLSLFITKGSAQILTNSVPAASILNSNAFLDASSSYSSAFGENNDKHKGLVFPDVNLTTFQFENVVADGATFPSYYDGMVVYNTATGTTLTTGIRSSTATAVTPGFYYFSNPDGLANSNVTSGVWTALGGGATSPNLTGMVTSVGNSSTVVTNANLTGAITSIGNTTTLGSFSSSNIASALSDETGTGTIVLATSPTLVTPNLGTPASLVGTNITGTATGLNIGGNAATATLATTATSANNTGITDDTTTALAVYPTFVTGTTGNLPQKVTSTKLSFVPSTGGLMATSFKGDGSALTGVIASGFSGTLAVANGGTGATTAVAALTNLGAQAAINLSSNITTDTGSVTKYPSVNAVQAYITSQATANATPDATLSLKGKIQLAGDLTGTAAAPLVAAGAIDDSKISETAAILDTKLATIATAGKVSNSATTATALNAVSTIVLRDVSGNFAAGAITATSFTGSGAGLTGVVSTTNANLTGMVTSVGNSSTVVTNANLTGAITSIGNTTTLGSFSSSNIASALSDETGTGTIVLATSPTLVTPNLGTPATLVGTNITGTASGLNIGGNAATATSANNTGITNDTTTALAVYPTFVTGITGNLPQKVTSTKLSFVPSTGTLTAISFSGSGAGLTGVTPLTNANLTGMVTSVGNSSTVVTNANLTGAITSSGNETTLGSFSSFNIASALSDETGTGTIVLATSPTLVTPNLGTPATLVGTNITGTASGLSIGGNAATTTLAITATNANNIEITDDSVTSVAVFPTFVTANTGNLPQKVTSTKLSFVPSTGVLSSTKFVGDGSGLTDVNTIKNITSTEVVLATKVNGAQLYAINGTFTATGSSTTVTVTKPTGMTGYYSLVTYQSGKTFRREIYSFDTAASTNNVITGAGPYTEIYPSGTYNYVLEYFK